MTTQSWADRISEEEGGSSTPASTSTAASTPSIEENFELPAARGVFVVGVRGGAGATTTALGLLGAFGERIDQLACVNSAGEGGDLLERGLTNPQKYIYHRPWQRNAGVLWGETHQSGAIPDSTRSIVTTEILSALGYHTIVDAGPWRSARHLRGIRDVHGRLPMVVTANAREAEINLLPRFLDAAETVFGTVYDVAIVLTDMPPTSEPIVEQLRSRLRDPLPVFAIPHDDHIAAGTRFEWTSLAAETAQQFRLIASDIRSIESWKMGR